MSLIAYLLVAVFLPLFPLSMVFNRVFAQVHNTWLRIALLVGWPLTGVALLAVLGDSPPQWLVYWGVATALLYGFRALALRDLALWLAHLATSVWALMWLPAALGQTAGTLPAALLAFAVPLALLAWLTGHLEKLFGAAYAGALGGLATGLPRLSWLLVLVVLAVIGTPLFPGFFALLGMVKELLPAMPVTAVGVLLVWMLWAWAGMRMLQGLIVGDPGGRANADIGLAHTGILGMLLAMFAAAGIWLTGSLV